MIKELEQIDIMIRARYPVIYIVTWEERRVIDKLKDILHNDRNMHIWSFTRGFRKIEEYDETYESTADPIIALNYINDNQDNALFILSDFHVFLHNPEAQILRLLHDLCEDLKKSKKTIIMISPVLKIPEELEKDIIIVDFPLPEEDEIKLIFEQIIENVKNQSKVNLDLSNEYKEQIIKALMGLTRNEIENVLFKSLVEKKEFSIEVIIREKEHIIRKTSSLEYFHSTEGIDRVGGLETLKGWIIKRKNAYIDKARNFGLPYPKGLLLIGVQGCGKSLCCKVIANLWNFPLLRLDVGSLFEGLVGSSESNIRRAIKLAESIAPCILWIDEIEKGFSGVKSSGSSDAGTSARVFGTFLTWMQEKEAPVFVVATANDISQLPPELLRKGRFDEIFFVDLPNKQERNDIYKIHIEKRKRDPSKFDLVKIIEKTNKFSGAEIESSIISALFDAFEDNLNDEKKDLTTQHILKSIEEIVPLAITLEEKINQMRKWAAKRARTANKPEPTSKKKI